MKTYFAYSRSMSAIKIGRSAAPDKRIADMRTACPDVVMAGVVDGDLESQYHQQFKQLKISREWFRADDDLADFLRREFLFKLPYNKAKLALTTGRGDSLQLAADAIAGRSIARAPLILNSDREEFWTHWYDLLGAEYPECEVYEERRADHISNITSSHYTAGMTSAPVSARTTNGSSVPATRKKKRVKHAMTKIPSATAVTNSNHSGSRFLGIPSSMQPTIIFVSPWRFGCLVAPIKRTVY